MDPFQEHISRVSDPLGEHTRSLRKYLILSCFIAIAVVKVGLFPSKITSLGIDFTISNQQSLHLLFKMAIWYFLVSFIVVGWSDLTTWKLKMWSASWNEMVEVSERSKTDAVTRQDLKSETLDHLLQSDQFLGNMWRNSGHVDRDLIAERISKVVSLLRSALEFFVPVLIGVCSLIILHYASVQK